MSEQTQPLEQTLSHDLESLGERLADDSFGFELYRALTNTAWRKQDGAEGHVSLSWNRAERLVNGLRERAGHPALTLAQTGGEGEVSTDAGEELGRLGWTSKPLDTSREDPEHVSEPTSAPPAEQGGERAPDEDPGGWERRAHEEADAHSERTSPRQAMGETGAGGGSG